MTGLLFFNPTRGQRRREAVVVIFCLTFAAWGVLSAGIRGDESKKGQPAGTCASEPASILRRAAGEASWHPLAQNEAVNTGDLLVGMPGSMVTSQNGAVRLSMMADLDRTSRHPILESAVSLHQSPGADLDFTLDRGLVEVENRKETGPANVRLHVRNDTWDVVLTEPGSTMAVELYGRWPRGVPFKSEPDPKHVPTASMVFLVVKGEVMLKHNHISHRLKAPPGPAMMEWDSVAGHDETAEHLDMLPAWAQQQAEESPLAKQKKAVLERLRQALLNKPVGEVLDEFLNSDQPGERRLALILMGALDDLPRLGKAMRGTKHLDVWEDGILALRHWIGRGPGQDQILYNRLIDTGKYKPVQAETLMELLHSFGDDDLARPETYQTLIDYLDHDLPGIRGLAYWHLVRLVPAGQAIGYNPGAPKEEREAAIQKWRKLVPNGKVPPRTRPAPASKTKN
jgi:hypothetical protein